MTSLKWTPGGWVQSDLYLDRYTWGEVVPEIAADRLAELHRIVAQARPRAQVHLVADLRDHRRQSLQGVAVAGAVVVSTSAGVDLALTLHHELWHVSGEASDEAAIYADEALGDAGWVHHVRWSDPEEQAATVYALWATGRLDNVAAVPLPEDVAAQFKRVRGDKL